MPKTAVILAAGLGSRLGDSGKDKPKGFISIGSDTLIERSIQKLREAGITNMVIGTGHQCEAYQQLANEQQGVKLIHSDKYATTNSMQTLFCMEEHLDSDFLLLESDLLYSETALEIVQQSEYKNLILASGKTNSSDEVFIHVDEQSNLAALSKNKKDLPAVYGELTGISKVSLELYRQMCNAYKEANNPRLHYEEVMQLVAKDIAIHVHREEKLLWCEIDNPQHYLRAISTIWPKIRAEEFAKGKLTRNVLLNPGPATTSDGVKMAQIVPDICPREQEFGELMQQLDYGLTSLVANPRDYSCVLFAASGTGAVEAAISSVVPHNASLLIVNNGAYGKRMCDIANCYNIPYVEFTSSTTEPVNLEKLEEVITANPELSHLAIVHNETTTGLLNNLQQICQLAYKHKLEVVVDGMSSYAAIPIDMAALGIDFLCASSNKNIQGMAGVSFVICKNTSLEKTKDIRARSHYFNLYAQYDNFERANQMRFTPPVQTLYALKQALDEVQYEGVEGRHKRYSKSWNCLMDGLKKLGLEHQVLQEHHSKIITAVHMPKGVSFTAMHDYLYARGFTIYPGKTADADCFRIANIGDIDYRDMENFLKVLEEYLQNYK